MVPKTAKWTNPSVVAFSEDRDPVEAVTESARAIVMAAMDRGWSGPPFDPLALAELLQIEVVAREDIRDARTVIGSEGAPRIEYNPTRPRGRVRYSLAHEIAHTMFPDWADEVRHRSPSYELKGADWQLEALCNIAAAEFVMPIGSFSGLAAAEPSLDRLLDERKRYDVSTEALLIRSVHLQTAACAMFCASPIQKGAHAGEYRVDYLIGSRAWSSGRAYRGLLLPGRSVVSNCSAIGFTAKGTEEWAGTEFRIEAVGIAPYPGSSTPRAAGLLVPAAQAPEPVLDSIEYLLGDGTKPHGEGRRMIVQVVNDEALTWGGDGFAAAVRRAWPHAQEDFRHWVGNRRENLKLGRVHFSSVVNDVQVASIVAQHGYGPSQRPRIRYGALREGLVEVARVARESGATVHMARIGCGLAGGAWDVVEELLWLTMGRTGMRATVYDLPGRRAPIQESLFGSLGVRPRP